MAPITFIISVPLEIIPSDIAQELLTLLVHLHLTQNTMDVRINKKIELLITNYLPYFIYDDRMMNDLFKLEVEAEEIVIVWRMTDLWKII